MTKRIKVGDTVYVGTLELKVEGFTEVAGQKMVRTDYGDFNVDLVNCSKSTIHMRNND